MERPQHFGEPYSRPERCSSPTRANRLRLDDSGGRPRSTARDDSSIHRLSLRGRQTARRAGEFAKAVVRAHEYGPPRTSPAPRPPPRCAAAAARTGPAKRAAVKSSCRPTLRRGWAKNATHRRRRGRRSSPLTSRTSGGLEPRRNRHDPATASGGTVTRRSSPRDVRPKSAVVPDGSTPASRRLEHSHGGGLLGPSLHSSAMKTARSPRRRRGGRRPRGGGNHRGDR